MKKNHPRRSDCPINFALNIFGDKWSLLIIRDLMFSGKKHYGEFSQSAEKISTNILAERLERLELVGIISKTPDPMNLSKYVYLLTRKGVDLLPVLLDITSWSAKYDTNTATSKSYTARLKYDRVRLEKEILDKLKTQALQAKLTA